MDKMTSYFQLSSQEEREKKIDELKVLEQELASLKKNAKVYQSHGNSNILFIADRDKVHSETKLSITKLTETHKKLQK
ncbi:hypothetical protein GHT06_017880 [Daphnia sinensis]|uniref:Uncharacterized protein n=1 Tax=Daphnia sinensis TaxID=1820382 RepID=A0AAD5KLS2_9CRUS|nr:hypothetical protein GHT06_017880 [Daphnia sinensis]